MTLLDTIKILENLAAKQPSVALILRNSIFRLNALENAKYGVFCWTQQQHTMGDIQVFSFALFYVDRLNEGKSNEVEIQSVGIQTLNNIIKGLEDKGIYPVSTWQAQTFNQRFLDECAGVWASVQLQVPVNSVCSDDYEISNTEVI